MGYVAKDATGGVYTYTTRWSTIDPESPLIYFSIQGDEMTRTQILNLVQTYQDNGFPPDIAAPCDVEAKGEHDDGAHWVAHMSYLLTQIPQHVEAGEIKKAMRWLGFFQGCLWMSGIHSLTELGNHNRTPR